ncbi:MAG: hypothetical protein E6I07_03800 [Chloroflexi bacterium]|nr:MAG: hypothetical protein E6I07_03800 [Chloroflexota bacterium]
MAEPEAESITGGPTPEPPLEPSDIARKVEREGEDRPLPEKAKTAASELDREVSGEYEAKQERDAGKRRRR